ncbi:Cilia- and flagella-associated protein 300 [Frankliniella fusca]|uniref:Cilia- and flagella-associated protein 300 n=1 Tax=Frankliniella fusca TaxID=407009 RepID=A0AAE1HZD9_9NEOP|nr:Cilia- and flagella-associated protein 300 [Frankliniella fusca]
MIARDTVVFGFSGMRSQILQEENNVISTPWEEFVHFCFWIHWCLPLQGSAACNLSIVNSLLMESGGVKWMWSVSPTGMQFHLHWVRKSLCISASESTGVCRL